MLTSKGFTKEKGFNLTFDDVKGFTLEQKLLCGYYKTKKKSDIKSSEKYKDL